jgi:hypothetical protein
MPPHHLLHGDWTEHCGREIHHRLDDRTPDGHRRLGDRTSDGPQGLDGRAGDHELISGFIRGPISGIIRGPISGIIRGPISGITVQTS